MTPLDAGHWLLARKQLEEELVLARKAAESASAAKGRFLANVTHELRAPLNAIVGYSHLVKRGLQYSQQHGRERHMLRMIESTIQHLASMIDDLLDMSVRYASFASVLYARVGYGLAVRRQRSAEHSVDRIDCSMSVPRRFRGRGSRGEHRC